MRGFHRRTRTGVVVDESTQEDSLVAAKRHLVDALIHTAEAYIAWGRGDIPGKFSKLELEYMEGRLPADFDDRTEEEQWAWLDENRETDDHGLILHVINNHEKMELKRYKLQTFYILNTLAISERWFSDSLQ